MQNVVPAPPSILYVAQAHGVGIHRFIRLGPISLSLSLVLIQPAARQDPRVEPPRLTGGRVMSRAQSASGSSPPFASSVGAPISPISGLVFLCGGYRRRRSFPMAHESSEGRGRGRRSTPRRGGAAPDPRVGSSSANEAVRTPEVSSVRDCNRDWL
jgi:hypothetical protein